MSTPEVANSPRISTLAYVHSWRRMRRAAHEALTKVAVQRYHPVQTKEATILVSALLADPENREKHIQRTAASAIMSITYDYPTLASGQDKAVQEMDKSIHFTARAAAGTFLVEFFPWIIHIPQRSTRFLKFKDCTHINYRQVFEVEGGSIKARWPAFGDVSAIIQSCQNGPCTSC